MRTWKYAILPTLFLVFVTSWPQIYLCYQRGVNWNGGFAYLDPDEFGYAGYVQALIDGHPRLIDPYTGRHASENLFSIQFIPAYALAIPGRILGLSASMMFVLATPLITILSALLIFKLVYEVTGNKKIAGISILGVLTLATAVLVPLPLIGPLTPRGFGYFPFLRTYVPAVPFPLIFIAPLCLWRALTKDLRWAVGAGLCFSILVFSYFYLWTALLAWFAAILLLWAVWEDRKRALKVFAVISPFFLAIIPFAWMIIQRAAHSNNDLVLRFTHKPDLTQTSVVLGLIILATILIKKWHGPAVTFAASLALVPLLVFNQQIVTGRSLQPFHYSQVVANYWIVMAIFILFGLWRGMTRRMPLILTAGCLFVGSTLGFMATRIFAEGSILLDKGLAIKQKLRELGPGRVYAPDLIITNSLVAIENPMLWAQQNYTFSNISHGEQRKRFFAQLYLQSIKKEEIRVLLEKDFLTRIEAFGDRANELITAGENPITQQDIERASAEINAFYDQFQAPEELRYAVMSPNDRLDNLRRWYSLDELGKIEGFTIYNLTLRP
jgi:hypothetical protein